MDVGAATFRIGASSAQGGIANQAPGARADDRAEACAVCGKLDGLVQDHSHDTQRCRGLLCNAHNAGLGMFSDDPVLLMRAADYVTAWRAAHDAEPARWALYRRSADAVRTRREVRMARAAAQRERQEARQKAARLRASAETIRELMRVWPRLEGKARERLRFAASAFEAMADVAQRRA
jgi:hypothetical protein